MLVGAATVRAEGYRRLLRPEARERRERERAAAEPLLVRRQPRREPRGRGTGAARGARAR